MRKFRQTVLHVLDPAAADDLCRLAVVGLPECRLVDPTCLLEHALAEAEGMEHFHRAARDPTRLSAQHPARLLLDDAGLDVGKCRQLRGKRQPRRSAAYDQDIDLFGEGALCARGWISFRRIEYFRVTRLETIEMKLHAGPAQVQFMSSA